MKNHCKFSLNPISRLIFSLFLLLCLLTLLPRSASAESISGISLGDDFSVATSKLGKPTSVMQITREKADYLWEKENYRVRILTWNNKIFFIRFFCDIGIKKGIEAVSTKKGVHLGDGGSAVLKNYGDGKYDYQYPSEDCGVVNYNTGKKETAVFRVYQGGDTGVIIDIVLCQPNFPKDKIWE